MFFLSLSRVSCWPNAHDFLISQCEFPTNKYHFSGHYTAQEINISPYLPSKPRTSFTCHVSLVSVILTSSFSLCLSSVNLTQCFCSLSSAGVFSKLSPFCWSSRWKLCSYYAPFRTFGIALHTVSYAVALYTMLIWSFKINFPSSNWM